MGASADDPEPDPEPDATTPDQEAVGNATGPPQHPLRCPDLSKHTRIRMCTVALFWLGVLLAAGAGMLITRQTQSPPRAYTSNEVYSLVVIADSPPAAARAPALLAKFSACPRVQSTFVMVSAEEHSTVQDLPATIAIRSTTTTTTNTSSSWAHPYHPPPGSAPAVLLLDASLPPPPHLTCDDITLAFNAWLSAQRTLVGFTPRLHSHLHTYHPWDAVWRSTFYSMILPTAAFVHKDLLSTFAATVPPALTHVAKLTPGCEGILLNYVISDASRVPPLWVDPEAGNDVETGDFACDDACIAARSQCLKAFSDHFGRDPLYVTDVRVRRISQSLVW